jgi:hypothetical protein
MPWRRRSGRSVGGSADPLPKHPYRDSAVFHLGLGVLILLFAWLTGGELTRAVVVAAVYVVLAVGWSWYRFRQRIERAASSGTAPPGR